MDDSKRRFLQIAGTGAALGIAGCLHQDGQTPGNDSMNNGAMNDGMQVMDPDSAETVSVDRFSEEAGNLMVRTDQNNLPGQNEPVNFDQAPFLTKGLGPNGGKVEYYNFDVQPRSPAPIYVLFRENETSPVEEQLNIIDAIPGDDGYNDFWRVNRVTVPMDYEANTATSLSDINSAGYSVEATDMLVNCPVVPEDSTASKRHGDSSSGTVRGWYKNKVVHYFEFTEATLKTRGGQVPLSPIYVSFNKNPDQPGGGAASGFVTEEGSDQTHNVVATVPGDTGYSPLWNVNVYNNSDFGSVSDLDSATAAEILAMSVTNVNCPIVEVHSGDSMMNDGMESEGSMDSMDNGSMDSNDSMDGSMDGMEK